MYYLYCVVEYNGNSFLAKIAVEEYGDGRKRRAYNVDRIKMSSLSRKEYDSIRSNPAFSASSNDNISVSTLFTFVKEFDSKFNPRDSKFNPRDSKFNPRDSKFNPREVNSALLNEDGVMHPWP